MKQKAQRFARLTIAVLVMQEGITGCTKTYHTYEDIDAGGAHNLAKHEALQGKDRKRYYAQSLRVQAR